MGEYLLWHIQMQYLSNVKSNHTHQFAEGNPLAQKKILIATILTGVMMVFEIFGGWFFGGVSKSMLKQSRLNFDKIEKCE